MKTMTPKLMTITPSMAKEWLGFNVGNRRLPKGNVKYFSDLIEKGEFQLTHQGLAFSGTEKHPERLLDGQTRLSAVLESGLPITQWVFWNADPKTFSALDGGKSRTFQDHYGWEKDHIAICNIINNISSAGWKKLTKTDADEIFQVFGNEIRDVCGKGSHRKGITSAGVRSGIVIAMHAHPEESARILDLYRAMASDRADLLTPSTARLWAKMVETAGGSRDVVRHQLTLTVKAMNPKNWNLTRLHDGGPAFLKEIEEYVTKERSKASS